MRTKSGWLSSFGIAVVEFQWACSDYVMLGNGLLNFFPLSLISLTEYPKIVILGGGKGVTKSLFAYHVHGHRHLYNLWKKYIKNL